MLTKSKLAQLFANYNNINDQTVNEFMDYLFPGKEYIALLNQSGTAAPVSTILKNDIGEIEFTYEDEGYFLVTGPVGAFKNKKTFVTIGNEMRSDVNYEVQWSSINVSDNTRDETKFYIFISDDSHPGEGKNDVLFQTYFKITVLD